MRSFDLLASAAAFSLVRSAAAPATPTRGESERGLHGPRANRRRLAGVLAGFADGVDAGTTDAANAPVVLSGSTIGMRSDGYPAGGIWMCSSTGDRAAWAQR